MNIAILEIVPDGHLTYVESIAAIYSSVAENRITVFTTTKGKKGLQYIENQQVKIIDVTLNSTQNSELKTQNSKITEGVNWAEKLTEIANQKFDKIIVVTLEAYAKEPFRIAQAFEKIDFGCPIDYVVHNIDFWFEQSFLDKIRHVFFVKPKNLNDFLYRTKVYFQYAPIHQQLIKKVKNSNGKFACLSETVGRELAKYVGQDRVAVVPFSVFENKLADKSIDNQRLRVCLPGYVAASRRDYDSILDILSKYTEGGQNDLTIEFLGGISKSDGGEKIRDKAFELIKKGVDIIIHDKDFVSLQEFDASLAKADIVLGNLHLRQGVSGAYGKTKESGLLFTMIKAAKVGLVPSDYPIESALKSSVLTFENYENAFEILINLSQNREKLNELKQKARQNSEAYRPLSIYERLAVSNQL